MRSTVLPILFVMSACPDRSISQVNPTQQGEYIKDIPVSADVDILFVIDNSASTSDKQMVFAANFPKFVQALDAFPTGRPNLHIGVVSTTVDIHTQGFGMNCPSPAPNDDGLLQTTPRVAGCAAPNGRFLSDIKNATNTRTTNYSGTLDSALSCIAQLGATGCGFEAPLEAMKKALDGSRPENTGFLRDGAFLAVVILTDEDDCSVKDPAIFQLPAAQAGPGDFRCQPLFAYRCDTAISPSSAGSYANCHVRTDSYLQDPALYAQFLSAVKPPGKTVVALIAGDPSTTLTMTGAITTPFTQQLALEPSCMATINGQPAIGRPANRLQDFLTPFGDHGLFRTVCQPDYSQALTDVGKLLFKAISPCLEGMLNLADVDPANPGLQPDCTVSDIQNADTGTEHETAMPTCQMTGPTTPNPAGARPCWWVAPNPASCTTDTKLELHVERTTPPSTGTSVRVACATGP
ncbi:MAG: hypothetical protein JWO36_2950 [Myxococcales bacterium]|nr:hypothetical protein [Myxococcales bacterium]